MAGFGASAGVIGIPRYCFVFLYSSRVGGRGGVRPPTAVGAGEGASNPSGLLNWHCFVTVFSYSVRPSGSCVVVHGDAAGGGVAPGAANRAELPPLGGGTPANRAELPPLGGGTPLCWFSTQSVIIIIATDPVAQLTMGDPVQYADDMLPLTSSAILMRFPVGVTF